MADCGSHGTTCHMGSLCAASKIALMLWRALLAIRSPYRSFCVIDLLGGFDGGDCWWCHSPRKRRCARSLQHVWILRLEVREQGVDGLPVNGRLNGIVGRHGACYYRKSVDGSQKCLKVFVGLLALSCESQLFLPPTEICPCDAQDPLQPLMTGQNPMFGEHCLHDLERRKGIQWGRVIRGLEGDGIVHPNAGQ
jgi:hypothetical protein